MNEDLTIIERGQPMLHLRMGAILLGALFATPALAAAADSCGPVGDFKFVCDAEHPEDLLPVPGTRWIIASGFAPGSGLKLVDSRSKTLHRWFTGAREQIDFDRTGFGNCPSAPSARAFEPHGISLMPEKNGHYRLLTVNHGGRETIEVFDVDANADVPLLTWRGCIQSPSGFTNSVAQFSDGTILVSVLTRPGTTIADFVRGRKTGGVFEWMPGGRKFHFLRGTDLPGDNGLATDPDQKHFYVVAFGLHAIAAFSRFQTEKPIRISVAPGFMPDNIHWVDGHLIAAGMMSDEPACGGVRKVIRGVADGMMCHRGYGVAEFYPEPGKFRMIAYGEPNPAFNGVSSALLMGDTLWLGSYQADRIAYRRLPGSH